jgi:pyruvate/2-oxoglutarate dehydrogenase complex dihydrolipoamide dehydrogenase (E3) component
MKGCAFSIQDCVNLGQNGDCWECGTAGARVALCELPRAPVSSDEFGGTGGTCVLRGCVPKKLMSYAAHFAEDFDDAHGFG